MPDARLPPAERADLILRLMDSLMGRVWSDIDVILVSFGLPSLQLDEDADRRIVEARCRAALQSADASTLTQLAVYALELDDESSGTLSMPQDDAEDLWGSGIVRVFLAHLATEREFVGEVHRELRGISISSFVAHDNIDVSREWQDEIERALRTADVLVGLVHSGFADSFWTQQEVGWALGREIPVLLMGLGEPPRGFPARYQAPMLNTHSSAWQVASAIAVWLTRQEQWRSAVINGLVGDLEHAGSFVDARDAAHRLKEVGRMTPAVLDAIEHAYLWNDQLYGHVGARVVAEILEANGREFPPGPRFLGPSRR